MIHKNRGNRRWVDKRKRRNKYNLCQRIWGDAKTFLDGVLGKYDKGKIHDKENYKKTNNRVASKDYMGSHKMGNNYSHSDKKKIESYNDKLEYYLSGEQEHDELVDLILENDFYGDELLASYNPIDLEYEKFFNDELLSKPSYQHFSFVLAKEECEEILLGLIKKVQNINERSEQ